MSFRQVALKLLTDFNDMLEPCFDNLPLKVGKRLVILSFREFLFRILGDQCHTPILIRLDETYDDGSKFARHIEPKL